MQGCFSRPEKIASVGNTNGSPSIEIILIPFPPFQLSFFPKLSKQTLMTSSKRGRKPKEEWQLLRNEIKLRFDDGDYAVLLDKARESGLSVSKFCTRAIMDKPVRRALTDEEYSMVRTLQGIANNLNQLTRLANGIGFQKVVSKKDALMNLTLNLLSKFRM